MALCVQCWQNGCNLKTQTLHKSCQAVSINIPKIVNKVDLSFTSMLFYWTCNNADKQKSDAVMSQKLYEIKIAFDGYQSSCKVGGSWAG